MDAAYHNLAACIMSHLKRFKLFLLAVFIKYMLLGYNRHVRLEKSDLSCPREDLFNPLDLPGFTSIWLRECLERRARWLANPSITLKGNVFSDKSPLRRSLHFFESENVDEFWIKIAPAVKSTLFMQDVACNWENVLISNLFVCACAHHCAGILVQMESL